MKMSVYQKPDKKLSRRVIRAAYLGEDAGDLLALEENPNAVEEIRKFQ